VHASNSESKEGLEGGQHRLPRKRIRQLELMILTKSTKAQIITISNFFYSHGCQFFFQEEPVDPPKDRPPINKCIVCSSCIAIFVDYVFSPK